ncbi:MAG: transglutaminase domain-containing protein, partial [Kordiimonadaceae bacterium]|nr:transglutaminase domain-containing protein [Kordiimonadaceae bacterium]
LEVPDEYRSVLDELTPDDLSRPEAIAFAREFFREFRYTLYQQNEAVRHDPMRYFLTQSKAGHCEYFASATAMLLRQMGVPARYVVGYSIQEWSKDLKMYVVRERHAHAWAIAWTGDQWVTVDTTPSQWLAMEENASSFLQPLWDYLGNRQFQFTIWWNDQRIEDYETELYIIGGLLVLILIWRISTSEQVIIDNEDEVTARHYEIPGEESPFFRIEGYLTEQGFRRGQGELMTAWLLRIGRPELLPMLARHNRWRFDPQGISITDREQLADQVADWLAQHQETAEHPAS